jgi:hypothetical protein
MNIVANPGSTLGEAIGALIEREVNRILRPIAEENDCVYVTAGRPNPRTGRPTKLLLKDAAGNDYNIDSVIANDRMQPLVLIESEYIRYTKHNHDKGSWICTAHYSLRRQYPTVRKSIAVLAGSWSRSSKALLESFDVSLFEVGFPKIVDTLAQFGVGYAWHEKDRDAAMTAWRQWEQLSEAGYDTIARTLLADIEPSIRQTLQETLDTATPREIRAIEVTLETNLGETHRYIFESVMESVDFLANFDEEAMLNDSGPVLWSIGAAE